jgi:hypothetical protein
MPVSPFTNDFMRALPAALRPNPYAIDEEVMKAVENGWDTDSLAKACYMNDRVPNPAFVVTNLRNLCQHPQKQVFQRTGWQYGHIDCDRHPNCEICRCIPGDFVHHERTPVAKDFPRLPIGRPV